MFNAGRLANNSWLGALMILGALNAGECRGSSMHTHRRSNNTAALYAMLLHRCYNRLEALQGSRAGQHSIRINDQFRICFTWTEAGAKGVEIVDYH